MERPRTRVDRAAARGQPAAGTVLRGREAELAELAGALADLHAGRGAALLVEGPPGVGRTALLHEAVLAAARTGCRTLAGEASETLRTPFAPLLAALSGADPPVLGAEAARAVEAAGEPVHQVLHELGSALGRAAAASPLVVALDDLQWADPATLAALRALVPAPGMVPPTPQAPILWVLAARDGPRPRALAELVTRLGHDGARRLHLGGLRGEAVAALVDDLLRAPAEPALLDLVAGAGGNPGLLVELIRGLGEEGRLRAGAGRVGVVGQRPVLRLTALAADRLDALSADAQRLVRVAAVLPPRFTAAQLAAALRWVPTTVLAPLHEALEADLLAEDGPRLCFRHDLLRQAVLGSMPGTMRRALQRDAVALLLDAGIEPGEVARQLADSAEPGDRSAALALRAAAQHLAATDGDTAAGLAARALELLPAVDPDRGLFTAETVTLLQRAGRAEEAAELAVHALDVVLPPAQEAEVRLSLAGTITGPTRVRAEENRRALALPGLPPLLRGRHHAWLAYNLAVGGESDAVTAPAGAALQEARLTGDVETQVVASLALAVVEAGSGRFSQALARLPVLGRWSASQLGARPAAILDLHRAFLLAVLGRLDEARAIAAAGTVAARGEADALLLIKWAEFEGMLRLAAGELAGPPTPPAAAGAVTGAGPGGPPEETFSAVARMTASCLTGLHAGDAAALRAGRAAARKVGAGSSTAVRRLARRLLALTSSGPRAAADSARLLADDPLVPVTALVPCDHGYQPWTARLARTAGHHELAERAVAATAAVDARNPGVPVLAGLAVHTRGVVADDPDLLLDAARVLAGTRRRLLAAAAAEDAGLALAGRQYGDDAATWLENALQLYRDAGALADARRVGRLLRRHGGPRRAGAERPGTGWASLTSSELQVVRMIGRGATNRAAAQELYLSPHTVSSHVRSAFAKLGIHSRVQLAHVLQEFEP